MKGRDGKEKESSPVNKQYSNLVLFKMCVLPHRLRNQPTFYYPRSQSFSRFKFNRSILLFWNVLTASSLSRCYLMSFAVVLILGHRIVGFLVRIRSPAMLFGAKKRDGECIGYKCGSVSIDFWVPTAFQICFHIIRIRHLYLDLVPRCVTLASFLLFSSPWHRLLQPWMLKTPTNSTK